MKARGRRRRSLALTQAVVRPLYGVAFLIVLTLLLGLSVAVYQKAFIDVVPVTLKTDRIGNQLAPPADVKIRGLIVGEVRKVRSDGTSATIEMALDPDSVGLIPANVSARLLPKTLFGEKYVDLVLPEQPAPRPIRAGDVIPQDRSSVAIELEQVLDDLLPLLRTIKPEKLSATLNALATGLEGRGDALGENLVGVKRYFEQLNPKLPAIQENLRLLADVTTIYADAVPDLLRLLRNTAATSRTFAEQADVYAGFLAATTQFATTTRAVVRENEDRIIRLAAASRPVLAVLAKYSPEYPCLLEGLRHSQSTDPNSAGALGAIFNKGYFHITLEIVPQQPAYQPGDEPQWRDKRGPNCFGLPHPPYSQKNPYPGVQFRDGTEDSPSPNQGRALTQALVDPTSGYAGTAEEQGVVAALLGPQMGGPDAVPGVATLLWGPMVRGTEVRQS
jgi:phospholipid/cholesterol/gamma-HCH transport system substrate-binding protein